MKITATPTDDTTDLNGVECRIWRGVDEHGHRFLLYVHRIAAPDGTEAELCLASAFQKREDPDPDPTPVEHRRWGTPA